MSTEKKRVLVVDDHPLFREGVVRFLERQTDLMVCGEASNRHEALAQIQKLSPNVLLLDLALGQADGLELIKQVRSFHPSLPILVLSMHDEDRYAERALKAGADGYAMKHQPPDEIARLLRLVLEGEVALTPRMATKLLRQRITRDRSVETDPVKRDLSDRELHVFRLIGCRIPNREIAQELNLSVKTVETYRENIKQKLGLRNADELSRAARDWVDRG